MQKTEEVVSEAIKIGLMFDVVGELGLLTPKQHTVAVSLRTEATILPAKFDYHARQDYICGPNTFGYLPAGMRFDAAFLAPTTSTYVMISDTFLKTAAIETIDPNRISIRHLYGVQDPIAINIVHALGRAASHGQVWPLMIESMVAALSARLLQILGSQPMSGDLPYPEGLSENRLRLVIEYIEDNISRPIRLEELSNVAVLSPFHFARSFRKAMNITPLRYVWQRRVECAKRKLRDMGTPLVHIAYECGFTSQSHFNTVFKRETGMTPTAYRATMLSIITWWTLDIAELIPVLALI